MIDSVELPNSERNDEEEDSALEGRIEKQAVPTKWKGDFVALCDAAKARDPEAMQYLWNTLYTGWCKPIFDAADDVGAAEEAAAEFCDRYVIGWINLDPTGNQKVGEQPADILSCTMNYRGHIKKCLGRFIYDLYRKANTDPYVAGLVVPEETPVDSDVTVLEDDSVDHQDFFVSETGIGVENLPGTLPEPYDEVLYQQLHDRCLKALTARYQPRSRILTVFEMLAENMTQEDIAKELEVSIATIRRDVAEIRQITRSIFNV